MAMTREQVLAEMTASYEKMTDEQKNEHLFTDLGKDWTPTLLLAEVQGDTEYGKMYVESWSRDAENRAALQDLLLALLGGGTEGLMTCGDPNCPNCKGEVRPFDALPGTGTDGGSSDPNAN